MVSIKNATDSHYITPHDINEMPNGDLLLGGKIGTSPDSLDFTHQAWIMRVNDKGCFDGDCSHVDKWWYFPEQFPVGTSDLLSYYQTMQLVPNPFHETTTLILPNEATFPIYYQITNIAGQTFSQGALDHNKSNIETNHLASGSYLILCKDKSGNIYYQKGIKI